MLRSLAISTAEKTPVWFKKWVHNNRFFDRIARKTFSGMVAIEGGTVAVKSGPLTGLKLAVSEHTSHAHISGTYELETQHAIDELVQSDFVCYDLGASIGYLSLLMARKGKHVYAFEPAPHAANEIRKHIAANRFENITIIGEPVSDQERQVKFAMTDVAYGSGIAYAETEWPSLELTATTLDKFAGTHPPPDFIKIDVEGEEGRVLVGAQSLLQGKKPIICCEIHNEEAAREVQRTLAPHGYRVTTLDGGPFQLTDAPIPGEVQILAFPK